MTYSPRITSVQYCGGCSVLWGIALVLWGIALVHVGDSISTADAVQYCGEWHQYCGLIASVLWRNSISNVEAVQYCGGMLQYMWGKHQHCAGYSVLQRDSCSTVGDSISTCGGIASVLWRDSISTRGRCSLISTSEAFQYCRG